MWTVLWTIKRTFYRQEKKSLTKYEKRIENLKEAIAKYKKYGERQMDLREAIKTTIEFLKSGNKDEIALVDLYEDNHIAYDPAGIAEQDNPDSLVISLEKNLSKINQQVEMLEKTLAEYESIVNNHQPVHRYDLHSILMHYGGPESGHYYSFIYDPKSKIWRKYDDRVVSIETEEKVFKEAIGDGKNSFNAYYLIYLENKNDELETSILLDSPASGAGTVPETSSRLEKDFYSMLPPKMKQMVHEKNLNLDKEIMKKNSEWTAKSSIELYEKRHKALLKGRALHGYAEWNFISYLESLGDPHYKYCLLDSIISELNEGQISLNLVFPEDPMYKRLMECFIGKVKDSPSSLILHKEDHIRIESRENDFVNKRIEENTLKLILTCSIDGHWDKAVDIIKYYICPKNPKYSSLENKKKALVYLKVLILRQLSQISSSIQKRKFAIAFTMIKRLSQHSLILLDSDDAHRQKCKQYLEYIVKDSKEVPEEITKEILSLNSYKLVSEIEELPPEISNIIKKEREAIKIKWKNEWSSNFSEEIGKLTEKFTTKYKIWYEWYLQISSIHNKLSIEKMLQDEQKMNINL